MAPTKCPCGATAKRGQESCDPLWGCPGFLPDPKPPTRDPLTPTCASSNHLHLNPTRRPAAPGPRQRFFMSSMVFVRQMRPVKDFAVAFGAVAKFDALAPVHLDEGLQPADQFVGAMIERTVAAFEHRDAVLFVVGHVMLNISTESAQISGDGRNAQRDGFHRRVAPRFVVAREDAHVTPADKLLVIQANQRAGRGHEFRMEDDLHRIIRRVKKLPMPQMAEHRIIRIIDQIMRDNVRLGITSPRVNRALQPHHRIFRDQLAHRDHPARGRGLE